MAACNLKGSTTGSLALVTGAAGSLGRATVRMLVDLGPEVFPLVMNLASPEDIETSYQSLPAGFRDIDFLVNNAGILNNNKSEATNAVEWKNVLDINLNGVFFLSRLVIPGMKSRRWGRIINTASLAAKTGGITAGTPYSTS